MFVGAMRSALRYTIGAIIAAATFLLLAFSIDIVDSLQTITSGAQHQERESGTPSEQRAERLSAYSLVTLDVGEISMGRSIVAKTSSPLFSCLGHLRKTYGTEYVDVTALTLSIAAVEAYNRNSFRRRLEILTQDAIGLLGIRTDFTIGLAQIKTSNIERLYRSKIKADAPIDEIASFARTDCGNLQLAALLIEEIETQCIALTPDAAIDDLIPCTVQKYSGMDVRSRAGSMYVSVVTKSYDSLFDSGSPFFYGHVLSQIGASSLKNIECASFNPNRAELRRPPQAVVPADSDARVERMLLAGDQFDYVISSDTVSNGVVKIILPDQDDDDDNSNSQLSKARTDLLVKYSCQRYHPSTVEFFERNWTLPDKITGYCRQAGYDHDFSELYVLLYSETGQPIATPTTTKCPTSNRTDELKK